MSDISDCGWRISSSVDTEYGTLPSLADVDVAVVGAGAAGVAAAVVAAEAGLRVVLIEAYGFAGGAAVAGMSGTICGRYLATDDRSEAPRSIVEGFTRRFSDELTQRGGLTPPQVYGKTFTGAHDPLIWREVADALLVGAGVQVLFHTTLVDVRRDGDRCAELVVASKAGLARIRAARTIDASGDAAVVSRLGGGFTYGADGRIQNPTMFFRLGGVDVEAFLDAYGADTICPPWVQDALEESARAGADLPRRKIWIFTTTRPDELLVNATRLTARDGRMLNVIDPADFTIAEILGRRQVRSYADFIRTTIPGCANAHVIDTGVEAGIRQTRTIAGLETLRNDDVLTCRKRTDGIARCPWPIELHDGERPKLHWLLDDWYDVPFGTLVPAEREDVIVAGRCLSAEHEALASCRVTAQCFEYGHAAAQATVISLNEGTRYRDIPGERVASAMVAAGSALSAPEGPA